MAKVSITLKKSPIGCLPNQRKTLKALGFHSFIQITLNNFHVVEDYHQWQPEWHRC